ncbi:MAG: GNAT family protein [Dehalococcoidia bacterium]
MFLEGERVRLRAVEPEDAPAFAAWINDPEIRHLLGGPAYQYSLVAEEEAIRARRTSDWERGIWFALEATDGEAPRLIGNMDLRRLNAEARRGEVGMLIGDRAYWNRGYGSDALRTLCRWAFADLDLHRIELSVAEYNPRARRAYEKVGFAIEGRLREHRYIAGRYHDTIVMGLLRRDFEAATEPES